ncbi:hypothetical protein KUCAC02_003048 [Chaenocephalus aceratus]|uniref:Uncharacterized protein n=1 Tax=Chaenocephalus aceratus TaxID=36190 RepID=A0ACB9WKA2_CHAAC|nr:hypothetical protein KUCAC02_003048 [Chaenocephalus aceratus]
MFFISAASLSNLSETSSTQADEPTQSCSEESHEPQSFQEPEQEEVVSGACGGEEEHVQAKCLLFEGQKNSKN